jgi:ASCH domain
MVQSKPMKLTKRTRVITVQQPWATLIALGDKCAEYRSWPTSYTGTLAIASSKAFPKNRREQCETGWAKKMLRKHALSADDLPRDNVLCIMNRPNDSYFPAATLTSTTTGTWSLSFPHSPNDPTSTDFSRQSFGTNT